VINGTPLVELKSSTRSSRNDVMRNDGINGGVMAIFVILYRDLLFLVNAVFVLADHCAFLWDMIVADFLRKNLA
jgi:hypothetical protein